MKNNQVDGIKMKSIATKIQKEIPGLGFVLLTFDFGDKKGLANYIGNSNRSDIIKFLRETADRLDKGTDYMTPTNN